MANSTSPGNSGSDIPKLAWDALKRRCGLSGDAEHQFTLHAQALLDLCARGPAGYEMTADGSQVRFANGFQMMHANILAFEQAGMITASMGTCQTTAIGKGVLADLNAEFSPASIAPTAGRRLPDVFHPSSLLSPHRV